MAMSVSLQVRKEVSVLPELPLYWRAHRLPMGLDRGTAPLLAGGAVQPAKTPKKGREGLCLSCCAEAEALGTSLVEYPEEAELMNCNPHRCSHPSAFLQLLRVAGSSHNVFPASENPCGQPLCHTSLYLFHKMVLLSYCMEVTVVALCCRGTSDTQPPNISDTLT